MTAEAFIDIRAEFPAKLRPLFQPRRYKVMHGGRGGGKSWAVARALLLMAVASTMLTIPMVTPKLRTLHAARD